MPIENGQEKRFDPTAVGQNMGWVRGVLVSVRWATSSLRNTPRTNGKWATGASRRMETVMMNLLEQLRRRVHHTGKRDVAHSEKELAIRLSCVQKVFIPLI